MLKELVVSNPKVSIVVISLFVSLFINLVNYFVMDKEKVREMKAKQKELNAKMKEHKDDPKKVMELQKEMFSGIGDNFKHSLRPMMITMLPMLVVFYWIREVFTGTLDSWFWWYLVSAIIFSMIFRKLFKLP
jgi:uncharacterized membrane protein (DUF106 family)